jgi:hypothetical protein
MRQDDVMQFLAQQLTALKSSDDEYLSATKLNRDFFQAGVTVKSIIDCRFSEKGLGLLSKVDAATFLNILHFATPRSGTAMFADRMESEAALGQETLLEVDTSKRTSAPTTLYTDGHMTTPNDAFMALRNILASFSLFVEESQQSVLSICLRKFEKTARVDDVDALFSGSKNIDSSLASTFQLFVGMQAILKCALSFAKNLEVRDQIERGIPPSPELFKQIREVTDNQCRLLRNAASSGQLGTLGAWSKGMEVLSAYSRHSMHPAQKAAKQNGGGNASTPRKRNNDADGKQQSRGSPTNNNGQSGAKKSKPDPEWQQTMGKLKAEGFIIAKDPDAKPDFPDFLMNHGSKKQVCLCMNHAIVGRSCKFGDEKCNRIHIRKFSECKDNTWKTKGPKFVSNNPNYSWAPGKGPEDGTQAAASV